MDPELQPVALRRVLELIVATAGGAVEAEALDVRAVPFTRPVVELRTSRAAALLGVELTDEGSAEIAGRSRGTPRIANRLLRRVRDFAEVKADGRVTLEVARAALALYDVDELGLDRLDRSVLDALVTKFGGGPVGVATLAVAVGEEPHTVEEVCEPFLVRAGLLARTPRGRVATEAAWRHLGIPVPRGAGILGSLPGVSHTPGSSSETLFDA